MEVQIQMVRQLRAGLPLVAVVKVHQPTRLRALQELMVWAVVQEEVSLKLLCSPMVAQGLS